jgi:hypothetical protein
MAVASKVTSPVTVPMDAPALFLVLALSKLTRPATAVVPLVISHVTVPSMAVWTEPNATSAAAKAISPATVRMPPQLVASKADLVASKAANRLVATVDLVASVTARCNATHVEATAICPATALRVLNATTVRPHCSFSR